MSNNQCHAAVTTGTQKIIFKLFALTFTLIFFSGSRIDLYGYSSPVSLIVLLFCTRYYLFMLSLQTDRLELES